MSFKDTLDTRQGLSCREFLPTVLDIIAADMADGGSVGVPAVHSKGDLVHGLQKADIETKLLSQFKAADVDTSGMLDKQVCSSALHPHSMQLHSLPCHQPQWDTFHTPYKPINL